MLRDGTLPDGSPLPEGEHPFKLDADAIRLEHGEPALSVLKGLTTDNPEETLHPDLAADLLGFGTSENMLKLLSGPDDMDEMIDRRTNEIMRGKKTQLQMLTAAEVPTEARKAVHNEKRAELLRKELQILTTQDLPAVKGIISSGYSR